MIADPGADAENCKTTAPQSRIDENPAGEFQLFPNPRIAWGAPLNHWAALLAAHRQDGKPLLDLTVSNPTRAGLGDWDPQLQAVLGNIRTAAYLPLPEGSLAARQAVATWYADRAGRAPSLQISPEQILLTASSSESYAFLFQALCAPGDEVLAPLPSYPLFEYLAGLTAVKLGTYRLRYAGEWIVDFASLEAALTPRTRAIVVVNPNNPTGSFLRPAEQERLLAFCAARRLTLIADEVFEEYALAESMPPGGQASFAAPQSTALCVSLGGLSKTAGLPQMKLGWMILQGPAEAQRALRERLLLVADTYLSVSTPVQEALPGLLGVGREIADAIRRRIRANAAFLKSAAAAAPHLTVLPVQAGWNAVLRLPAIHSDMVWSEMLLRHCGVLVQPGFFYEFEGEAWLVLSLLPEEPSFQEAVLRLGAYVESTAQGAR